MVEVSNENEKETGEMRRREGDKEESQTGPVKRRCVNLVSTEA